MFVVAWKNTGTSAKLFPVDDNYYSETQEGAKKEARRLLVPLKKFPMIPDAIVEVDDEYVQHMLTSDKEIVEIGGVEFIEL